MEWWFLLGVLSYLSYALSTSIDKYMMNRKYDIIITGMLKMFFDGMLLLLLGVLFFNIQIGFDAFLPSLLLALIYAGGTIFYFRLLSLKDVGEIIPSLQALEITLLFFISIMVFHEPSNPANYGGIIFIGIGVFLMLSRKMKIPRYDQSYALVFALLIANVVYGLIAKHFLSRIEPIILAIFVYFFATLIMLIYVLLFRKKEIPKIQLKTIGPTILTAAVFGSLGTLLLFTALKEGDASKIYPLAAVQSFFIVLLGAFILKEKLTMARIIGAVSVFIGIFLISL